MIPSIPNIPQVSSDNLYKFETVSSIFVIIFSISIMFYSLNNTGNKIISLENQSRIDSLSIIDLEEDANIYRNLRVFGMEYLYEKLENKRIQITSLPTDSNQLKILMKDSSKIIGISDSIFKTMIFKVRIKSKLSDNDFKTLDYLESSNNKITDKIRESRLKFINSHNNLLEIEEIYKNFKSWLTFLFILIGYFTLNLFVSYYKWYKNQRYFDIILEKEAGIVPRKNKIITK